MQLLLSQIHQRTAYEAAAADAQCELLYTMADDTTPKPHVVDFATSTR